MNKKGKITLITNSVIVFVIFVVSVFCFIPSNLAVFNFNALAPIYNGNKNSNKISLMFNVYQHTDYVNSILDIGLEYGVPFTFFVGGCWADDNEPTLKRIALEGHELGNHGYFHKDHKNLSYAQNKSEIENANKIIFALSGVTPKLFAPPSGSFNDNTLKVCLELDMCVIMWSKDTIDWRDQDSTLIYNRATKNLCGGDYILMHPTKETVNSLPKIIQSIIQQGYSIEVVSKN